jgi:hypothetical protein
MKFFKRFSISKPRSKADKKQGAESVAVENDSTPPKEAIEVLEPPKEAATNQSDPSVSEPPTAVENEPTTDDVKVSEELESKLEPEGESPAGEETSDEEPKMRTVDTTINDDAVETETPLSPIEAASEAVQAAQVAAQNLFSSISQSLSTTFAAQKMEAKDDAPAVEAESKVAVDTEPAAEETEDSETTTAESEEPVEKADVVPAIVASSSAKTPKSGSSSGRKMSGWFKGLRSKKQKAEEPIAEKVVTESNEESIEVPATPAPVVTTIDEPLEKVPEVEEKAEAAAIEAPPKSPTGSALTAIAKSFSMASQRSTASRKSVASRVSKSFSNLSPKKTTSFDVSVKAKRSKDDLDIGESKSNVSAASEISGLVRYMSHRENVERGFEVLLDDFDQFNKNYAPPAEKSSEPNDNDSVAELLDDADKVSHTKSTAKESETPSESTKVPVEECPGNTVARSYGAGERGADH